MEMSMIVQILKNRVVELGHYNQAKNPQYCRTEGFTFAYRHGTSISFA